MVDGDNIQEGEKTTPNPRSRWTMDGWMALEMEKREILYARQRHCEKVGGLSLASSKKRQQVEGTKALDTGPAPACMTLRSK